MIKDYRVVYLDTEILLQLISAILAIIATVLGSKWANAKNELVKLTRLNTRLASALKATSDAIEDDRITPEEEKIIVERWRAVIDEAKKLLEG